MIKVFTRENNTKEFKEGYGTIYCHFEDDKDKWNKIIFLLFFDKNKKFIGFVEDKAFSDFSEIAKDILKIESKINLRFDDYLYRFQIYVEEGIIKYQQDGRDSRTGIGYPSES